jgi:hypothetical protein
MMLNTPLKGAVVIPGIAAIEVSNLGIISSAVMAFPNRITLISTARLPRGLGTTTLVHALAAVGGCPLSSILLESCSQNRSRIAVKWPTSQMVIEPIPPRTHLQSTPDIGIAKGTLIQLANAIHHTGRDQCLVLDRDVFDALDRCALKEAFTLLEASACQIIAFFSSVSLSMISSRFRKLVHYELVEDPANPGRSTLIPFKAG